MKPTACVWFEVPHGPTGSTCSQNRNHIRSRAARLRKPNTKRVRNGRNAARSEVSAPPRNGFLASDLSTGSLEGLGEGPAATAREENEK